MSTVCPIEWVVEYEWNNPFSSELPDNRWEKRSKIFDNEFDAQRYIDKGDPSIFTRVYRNVKLTNRSKGVNNAKNYSNRS